MPTLPSRTSFCRLRLARLSPKPMPLSILQLVGLMMFITRARKLVMVSRIGWKTMVFLTRLAGRLMRFVTASIPMFLPVLLIPLVPHVVGLMFTGMTFSGFTMMVSMPFNHPQNKGLFK